MSRELLKSWTKKDFKIDWFSGTGAGGQKRNKTQNCCRITHLETGFVETGQSHRERSRNQKDAFNRLAVRVVEDWQQKNQQEKVINEEVVRTYNIPDNRVTDHATGIQVSYRKLEDELDNMIGERMMKKAEDSR